MNLIIQHSSQRYVLSLKMDSIKEFCDKLIFFSYTYIDETGVGYGKIIDYLQGYGKKNDKLT